MISPQEISIGIIFLIFTGLVCSSGELQKGLSKLDAFLAFFAPTFFVGIVVAAGFIIRFIYLGVLWIVNLFY